MQPTEVFNILIIGRSGSGKSATTKLLTGNPAIKVANSLKEVTTDVLFHEGSAFECAGQDICFRILDIPGLDKIVNRAQIRELILHQLEKSAIALHAIIYVSSMTQRDTIDENKLFSFLQQLPWSMEQKKSALIPLLTKYDNLVIDAHEEDITSTKREFQEIFEKLQYGLAWSKRIYWINHTKSLEFKLKSYEEIREKYEKQVERLVEMIRKNKHPLTAQAIREVIQHEDKYILSQLYTLISHDAIPYKRMSKSHSIILKVQVEPQTLQSSLTAVSATSIGIFISKVCQKDIPIKFSMALMGVPIAIALFKLGSQSSIYQNKSICQRTSGEQIVRSYEHICQELNREMEREWNLINSDLQFKVLDNCLRCQMPLRRYKFFDVRHLSLTLEGRPFFVNKVEEESSELVLQIPPFQESMTWNPELVVEYELKRLEEESILKHIQLLRKQYCLKI